jgi:hypothetical protein
MFFAPLLQGREGFQKAYDGFSDKWIRPQYDEDPAHFDAFEDVGDPEVIAGKRISVLLI